MALSDFNHLFHGDREPRLQIRLLEDELDRSGLDPLTRRWLRKLLKKAIDRRDGKDARYAVLKELGLKGRDKGGRLSKEAQARIALLEDVRGVCEEIKGSGKSKA